MRVISQYQQFEWLLFLLLNVLRLQFWRFIYLCRFYSLIGFCVFRRVLHKSLGFFTTGKIVDSEITI